MKAPGHLSRRSLIDFPEEEIGIGLDVAERSQNPSEAKWKTGFERSGSLSDQSNQASTANQLGLAGAQRKQCHPVPQHMRPRTNLFFL